MQYEKKAPDSEGSELFSLHWIVRPIQLRHHQPFNISLRSIKHVCSITKFKIKTIKILTKSFIYKNYEIKLSPLDVH